MAIYSLNVSSVGRTTHAAGTAGAHLRYIARESATPTLIAHDIPTQAAAARTWMDRQEAHDRKNARVADRIRLAIPRELTRQQRLELVRDFCEQVTGNRVPWFAAIHQDGEDEHNPHAHILVRDRDRETGKRVLKWSDSGRDRKAAGLPENAVDMIRTLWEQRANAALEAAGYDVRIDKRSLEDQGLERDATIHIGPNAAKIESFVHRPQSKVKIDKRGNRDRTIDYPMIDAGRTRQERHDEIVDLNLERDSRSPDFATRARAQMLKEQIFRDRNLERQLVTDARRRTLELRRVRAGIRSEARRHRDTRDAGRADADRIIRERFEAASKAQRAAQLQAREAMTAEQSRLSKRFLRLIDITGTIKRKQAEQRRELVRQQLAERRVLASTWRGHREGLHEHVEGRFAQSMADLDARTKLTFGPIRDRHKKADRESDRARQARAAEREAAELRLEEQIREAHERNRRQEFKGFVHKPRLGPKL